MSDTVRLNARLVLEAQAIAREAASGCRRLTDGGIGLDGHRVSEAFSLIAAKLAGFIDSVELIALPDPERTEP